MGFLIAWGAGFRAGWLEQPPRLGHRGVLPGCALGVGIASLIATVNQAAFGLPATGSMGHYANLLMLAVCVILGGKLGLSRLRSKELGGKNSRIETPASIRQS